jgi:acetyl esterase/lipase
MLTLQPIAILTFLITKGPWLLHKPWSEEFLRLPAGHAVRLLIFKSKAKKGVEGKLRPLHLDMHGGAFIGGCPDMDAVFCNRLANETGAVVISTGYRYAPRYPFPAAIDDVDAVVAYLQKHAVEKYGADPKLMTMSGFSAGGNLALAATQQENCHSPAETNIKGIVTYYASIDLRLKPADKPIPANFPTIDPLFFLQPLFDCYAAPTKVKNMENPRMNPVVAKLETLPDNILLIIPTMDILLHEQLTFVKRLQEEAANADQHAKRKIESKLFENQIHGWVECKFSTAGFY